jgi:uncharacterized protein YidB (DUF937 family)
MGLLDSVLGGGRRSGGGMSPITMALLGLLAYRTMKGKGRLADMLGRGEGGSAGGSGGGLGGLGGLLQGGLGGLLGGAGAGGLLSGGLQDLMKQFQEHGEGDKMQSWVSSGPNQPIDPQHLERALGEERVTWLMEQTGLSKQELLEGLAKELPQSVDKLTPEGHIPTEQEAQRMQ